MPGRRFHGLPLTRPRRRTNCSPTRETGIAVPGFGLGPHSSEPCG